MPPRVDTATQMNSQTLLVHIFLDRVKLYNLKAEERVRCGALVCPHKLIGIPQQA